MQASPQGRKSREFSRLATKLGRELFGGGNHPNYVRTAAPAFFPLSIPNHTGDMPTGTACSIIESLLNDCDEWELWLIDNDGKENEENEEHDDSD
jgi:hypothetical protein